MDEWSFSEALTDKTRTYSRPDQGYTKEKYLPRDTGSHVTDIKEAARATKVTLKEKQKNRMPTKQGIIFYMP